MPQYLLSVWHDEDYDVDFSTPDAQRQWPRSAPSTTSCNGRAPGCSPAACTRRRRPRSCVRPAGRSR